MNNATKINLRKLLSMGVDAHWLKIHKNLLDELNNDCREWLDKRVSSGDAIIEKSDQLQQTLVVWLLRYLRERKNELEKLSGIKQRFISDYDRAVEKVEKERIIIDCAAELGASKRQLAADRRALKRWFDRDTILDRCQRRLAMQEQRLAFALERIGVIASLIITKATDSGESSHLVWSKLAIELPLRDLLSHEGDYRVVLATFHALAISIRAFPKGHPEQIIEEPTLRYIYRSALESRQNIWIQTEALEILESLAPESMKIVLIRRLENKQSGDDIFLRRRAVAILIRNLDKHPDLQHLLETLNSDPSPYVRQGFAESLGKIKIADNIERLAKIAKNDSEPAVRAAATLALVRYIENNPSDDVTPVVHILDHQLLKEEDSFVFRAALHSVVMLCHLFSEKGIEKADIHIETLFNATSNAAANRKQIPMRRWAAQAGEKIWLTMTPEAKKVAIFLAPIIIKIRPGSAKSLSRK